MPSRLRFRANGNVLDERGETVATIFRGVPGYFSAMVKAKPLDYATGWRWPYECAGTFETSVEARGCILARHFGGGVSASGVNDHEGMP